MNVVAQEKEWCFC